MNLGLSPEGHVTALVSGPRGRKSRSFSNVVLSTGWSQLVLRSLEDQYNMTPEWLSFGTSTEPADISQPGLLERDASTNKASSSATYGGFIDTTYLTAYSEVVLRFDYDAGTMTGEWSEVGLSFDSGYSQPYNRALIVDENNQPTPLLVLSDESLTVFVRLRLNIQGWGSLVEIAEGVTGVLQVQSDIASESKNIWKTGLPIAECTMGGYDSKIESFSPESSSAKHYFYVPAVEWSASSMNFYSAGGGNHFSFALTPTLAKPAGKDMTLRFTLTY